MAVSPDMTATHTDATRRPLWPVVLLLALATLGSYAQTVLALTREWTRDPNYSVGMIVPFAVLYLLWLDRDKLATVRIQPAWSGAVVLILAQAARLWGLAYLFESVERYSLLLTVAGLLLLVGGSGLLRRLAWILAIALLMVPLPGSLSVKISTPLQDLSTDGAVVALELLGVTVTQEGHVLHLDNRVPVAVAEACSGLRMLTAFIFVSAVFAYTVQRPRWQKIVILLSSIPIAILSNLIRLVATALLYMWTSDAMAERLGHDVAGWAMMPLAIAMVMAELWLMSYLVIEEPREPVKTHL